MNRALNDNNKNLMNDKLLMQQIIQLWENLHPTVRHVVSSSAAFATVSILMGIAALLLPYIVAPAIFFRIAIIERLWLVGSVLIFALIALRLLKSLWLLYRQIVSPIGFTFVLVSPAILIAIISFIPTFFEGAIRQRMDMSYGAVYGDLQALCADWEDLYSQSDFATFRPQEQPLGIFDDADVDVWRERNTVFFDMGDADFPYGFACVLDNDTPIESGRRSGEFRYVLIEDIYYQFYFDSDN